VAGAVREGVPPADSGGCPGHAGEAGVPRRLSLEWLPDMNITRWILGWLVAGLGGFGVLASVVAVAGVWVLSQRMGRTVDDLGGHVARFLGGVRERSEQVDVWLGSSRDRVEVLEQQVGETMSRQLDLKPDEWQAIAGQMRVSIERTRDWLAVAESTAELVKVIHGTLDSLDALVAAEGREELATALGGAAADLLDARKVLDDMQAAMAGMEGGRSGADSSAAVQSLLSRCGRGLGRLEKNNRAFTSKLKQIEDLVAGLATGVKRRITAGAFIATILLAWNGVAQWCLAGWGRRVAGSGSVGGNTRAHAGCVRPHFSDRL